MDFYNFFSFSSKKAIFRASEVCAQFGNQFLEPEHIFYSILNLRSCSGVQVLHQLGVNLPKLSYGLEAYLYEHSGSFKANAVFSQRTIALLDAAYKEVKRLHHREIGTTHLLAALSQERSPFLRQLFEEHNVDARRIREAFLLHLKGYDQRSEHLSDAAAATGALQEEVTFSFQKLLDAESAAVLRFARRTAEQYRHPELLPLHVFFALCLTARTDRGGFFPRAGVHQGRLLTALVQLLDAQGGGAQETPEVLLESTALLDLITRAFRSALERQSPGRSSGKELQITARDLLSGLLQDPDAQLQELLARFGLSPASLASQPISETDYPGAGEHNPDPENDPDVADAVMHRIAELAERGMRRAAATPETLELSPEADDVEEPEAADAATDIDEQDVAGKDEQAEPG